MNKQNLMNINKKLRAHKSHRLENNVFFSSNFMRMKQHKKVSTFSIEISGSSG